MANKTTGANRRGGRRKEKLFSRGDLSQDQINEGLLRAGAYKLAPSMLPAITGVHYIQVMAWLKGEKVTARVDKVLREAIGVPEHPAADPEAAPQYRAKHYSDYADAQSKEIGARPRKRGPYKKRSAA